MRAFGANKTALHFRRAKKRAAEAEAEGDEPQRYRLEEGDGTTHAQRIVRELYLRYEKQLQRWKDYRNLFGFLGFVALFLAVLYCQRSASIAYKVHSTVESVVVPTDNIMQDTDAVYSWLNGLLSEVWKDPVCGDGLCEAPFEFASYSRFGCRADCGKLSEVQNLTSLQVDMYYDFSHPVGSIPASDLMQQASWNLCPLDTAYSTDCYYDTDKTFERLAGVQNLFIDDAPDGQWNLVLRRDIFNKVRGSVRDTKLVFSSGYYAKIYIAAAAALAEQNFEISLLQQGMAITNLDFWTYANATIRAGYANSTEYEAAAGWVRNSTCFCSNVANDTTSTGALFNSSAMLLFLNQSVSRTDSSARFSLTLPQYQADSYYCPTAFDPRVWVAFNDSNGNWTKSLNALDQTNATSLRDWCTSGLNVSLVWRTNMTNQVQRLLIDRRLGDQRTTGKIAQRNTVNANLQGLAQRQEAAQKALETAVLNQLSAIKTATYQSIISLTQALALWKRARRDKALTLKAAKLANIPCNSDPSAANTFVLDNGNSVDTSTARERNVGLTNRVIAGLLLHQTRTNETLCPESKFDKIQKTCTGPQTVASFGVDPVFKRGTSSYNPDYDDAAGTQNWYTYMSEGLYLDQNTRAMTAELITYNAPLRIFSYFYIKFFFSDGGSIKVTHRLNTVRVELYNSSEDDIRFAFEIILSMWISVLLLMNLWEIAATQKSRGNFLKYFLSGWHWVEFASNSLLTACMVIWWVFKSKYAKTFDIAIRYDVYQNLASDANFLALNANGVNLSGVNAAFADLKELAPAQFTAPAVVGAPGGGGGAPGGREAVLEKERDQLAAALERLAEVQRELAEGQRNLMSGQKQLAEQQSKLVQLMNEQPPA
ncbi:hypothetical protein TSOC_008032 [Tetrabaena socialis]|uniref:Polycystin cation channel PKD1/PKD2 domain-containing protein n=1 Tax=Tetrabaena socialis TaxID=47790 RepID=A0A2J7ZZM2_9CHLO|nr:hypothetical protein TSOC_008032 [Tetrabaena socialis]|eukprot:PNH05688.1 hypothetical protein TSOC_008032 [Tetrabaena socialis]